MSGSLHNEGPSSTSDTTPSSSDPSDRSNLAEHIVTTASIPNTDERQIQDLISRYRLIEVRDLTGKVTKESYSYIDGNYADIYKGKWGRHKVAVKVLRGICSERANIRKAKRETVVWFRLHHKNILPLYGFCSDLGRYGALVSPWYEKGNANEFIRGKSETSNLGSSCRVTASKRFQLWADVVEGVLHLHSLHDDRSLVHGDLKPSNVLIDDDEHARICDFGLTRIILDTDEHSNLTTTTIHTGTARYLAYELAVQDDQTRIDPTKETDIWALGCLGLELVFLREPYATCLKNTQIYKAIEEGTSPPETVTIKDTAPEFVLAFWQLLEKCWDVDPQNRPTIDGLKGWVDNRKNDISGTKEDDFVLVPTVVDGFVVVPRTPAN